MISLLYPGNIKKEYSKKISHANRGMDLESLINETNEYYRLNDIAIIYKKPTPITIGNVDYEKNKKVLTKGYFQSKSTLDYVGIYKTKYLDFDAKVCKNNCSFPLKNVHQHQIKHMQNIIRHGGISFLIIEFNNLFYLLTGEVFLDFIKENQRKSIPYDYIKNKGKEIKLTYNPTLDYIKILEEIYFQEESHEKE